MTLAKMINWTREFTSLVISDKTILPNNYEIRLHILIKSNNLLKQNVAFERVKFFTDFLLHNSAFIDYKSKRKTSIRKQFPALNLIELPTHVFDQAVAIALFCKLESICEGIFEIKAIEVSSDVGDQVSYVYEDDQPLLMSERTKWFMQYDFLDPWWFRPALATYDKVTKNKEDQKVEWYDGTFNWEDIGLSWESKQNPIDKKVSELSKKVIKGPWRWQPKVIPGGKD